MAEYRMWYFFIFYAPGEALVKCRTENPRWSWTSTRERRVPTNVDKAAA